MSPDEYPQIGGFGKPEPLPVAGGHVEPAAFSSAVADGHADASPALRACSFQDALALLRQGRPLVVSTDTVYGLGVSVGHASAPDDLFRIKRRDRSKAIAWLMADPSDLLRYGANVSPQALALAEALWPGALTLVVTASDSVPGAYCAQDGSIALRVPAARKLRDLLRALGCAMATSSANVSGQPAATCLSEVDPRIVEFAPWAYMSDEEPSGKASTIVDCRDGKLEVLRWGDIAQADIRSSLGGQFAYNTL